jgi:hypothetical protein
VILDKNIRLIDSPGVVFADGDSAATTLRNCVNVETIEDVIQPVQAILEKCPPSYLMQLYSIPKFESGDVNGFLALVARGSGKLKKGGIPNLAAAAKAVLHDWNDGKIKFYVKPPAHTVNSTQARGGELQVVDEYSSEMDLANLGDADIRVLNSLEAAGDSEGGVSGAAFVAFSDYDMHFGETPKEEKISSDLTSVKAKSTIVKLSKKAIATKSDSGRPPRLTGDRRSVMSDAMSESRSVAGSLLSSTSVGVLSRRYDEVEQDSTDARKLQKLTKKKAIKTARRESKEDNVMDTDGAADYDFSSDFKY